MDSLETGFQGYFCVHLQHLYPTPMMLAKVFPTSDSFTSPRPGLPPGVPITRHLSASGHNLGVKECLQGCKPFSFTSLLPKPRLTKINEHGTKKKCREQLQHNLRSMSSPGAGRWVVGRLSSPLATWSVNSTHLHFSQKLTALFHSLVQHLFI